MKRICMLLMFVLCLCGCQAAQTFETVSDVYSPMTAAQPRQMALTVPEGARVIGSESGRLYLCDGYEITLETMSAGDLNATVRSLTGFPSDALTILETATAEIDRYECVWSAAGEGGDVVGRAVVLDDGDYHYCLTVTAPANSAGKLQETWQHLLDSFSLED